VIRLLPFLASAAVLIAALPAGAQSWGPVTIAGLTVQPGARASGMIAIPPRAGVAGDSGTAIPVSVIRGRQPGPTLALIAGTHGAEVAPVIGLQRLRAQLDPAELRGTLVLVHVANMPSFTGRTIYYSPVDGRNLNRVYPGRADGTVSERIAHAITNEVIMRADYVVDMHAGDGNESLRPYTYWNRLGLDARVDSVAREMALAWGHERIVVDTNRPRDPAASVYTQNTAHVRGKPSLTTETGYLGLPVEDMIALNVSGAQRLMRYLRMLPGPVELVQHPIMLTRTAVLTSPGTGTWHARVERGHTVTTGTVIGVLTDYFGNTVAEVRAPFAGEVLYVVATPAMRAGEPVAMIGAP
jgi:predicted deacylase